MDTGALFLTNLAMLAGALFVLWLVSLWMKNSSVIDVFWGLGFVAVAWLTLWVSGNWSPISLGLTLMVSLWGIRLASYLGWRNFGKARGLSIRCNAKAAWQMVSHCQPVHGVLASRLIGLYHFDSVTDWHQPRRSLDLASQPGSSCVAGRRLSSSR